MLAVFTKPLDSVTAADVAELVTQTWPEGPEVEFKGSLPEKRGRPHPWLTGGDVGDYTRDQILAEVIAFANALGGSVVLGVEETSGKPPRARAVAPLPRVGELARRLEDQARSCIDPPLPRLLIRPIETDEEGGGVILFRAFPSRAAPHRLGTTLEAFIRRGSSTVRMTMREIQDMTLNVARGLAGIDASFGQRRDAFREWATGHGDVVAYRVTALPSVDLPDPGRLFGRQELFLSHRDFKATVGNRTFDLRFPISGWDEQPRLRGVMRSQEHEGGGFRWELYQNGLIDLWVCARPRRNQLAAATAEPELVLYHSGILGAVANILAALNHYRAQIGVPEAEYGLEVELRRFTTGGSPVIYSGLFAENGMDRYRIPELAVMLPRLSVGAREEFSRILTAVDVDIYDGLGIRRTTPAAVAVNI